MSIYDDMQKVASTLITDFQQGSIKYVQRSITYTTPDEPSSATETLINVDGVVKGVSFKFVDHTNILTSDKQLTISADQQFTPDAKDFIEIDGNRYKILRVDAIPNAGTPVVYRLFIRN